MSQDQWLELPDIARRLRQALAERDTSSFDAVVGIATGGVVPASLVAFHLGLPLHVIHLNYRAADNTPQRPKPELLNAFHLPETVKHVLLVDDVSVSGQTSAAAQAYLPCDLTTLVVKGRGDIVLYPEVKACIKLPWRDY